MRPQRYGGMRKVNANFAFKEKTRLHRKQTHGQEREEETLAPFDGRRQLN